MPLEIFEARTTPWAVVSASLEFDADQLVRQAGAEKLAGRWTPAGVRVFRKHQDHRGVFPDIFAPSGAQLLVSPTALRDPAVRTLLEETGELLPMRRFDETGEPDGWAVYHCTTIADLLDEERSDLERFSDGRMSWVRTGVFRDVSSAEVPPIFRQRGYTQPLLFSDEGRSIIEESPVGGLEFTPAFERLDLASAAEEPLTVAEIEALPPDRLDDRVWMRWYHLVNPGDPNALRQTDPDVAAYLSTRLFEWEVMNGGLHQYFFNYPDPDVLKLVLAGFDRLGLEETRAAIEQVVAPIAACEAEWRESLRDGRIETFFDSYEDTALDGLDGIVEDHDHIRVALVRAHPEKFAG